MFLLKNNIRSLPLNLNQIAQQNNWILLQYDKNPQVADVLMKNNPNSDCESFACVYKGTPIIIYKRCSNLGRLRFSIAHEFGHIALLHLEKLTNDEYEHEANMFAARILMPMCVIKETKAYTPEAISRLCGVSLTAANYRANRLKDLLNKNKFYTSTHEARLVIRFSKFINQKKNKGEYL